MRTYSQIYIQIVFAVKYRESLVSQEWEDRLYKYITGIVQKKEQKMLAINGMPDHIHILIGMKPACVLSDLVREVKKASTEFIKENQLTRTAFNWQEGYGAFSYGHSQLDAIIRYIMNQKQHHKKVVFREEYLSFLKMFDVPYDERYIFEWM